jgi:hypothetical protein
VANFDVSEEQLGIVRGRVAVAVEEVAEVVHDIERHAAGVFVAGNGQLQTT